MLEIEVQLERFNKQTGTWELVPLPPGRNKWYQGPPNRCLASLLGLESQPWAPPPVRLQSPFINSEGPPPGASLPVLGKWTEMAGRRARFRFMSAACLSSYCWEDIRANVSATNDPTAFRDWSDFRRWFLGDTWGQIRKLQKPDLLRLVVWGTPAPEWQVTHADNLP